MRNFGLKMSNWGEIKRKIEILSTHNFPAATPYNLTYQKLFWSENFCSKIHNLWLQIANSREFMGKIEILCSHIFFVGTRKSVDACRKIVTFCLPMTRRCVKSHTALTRHVIGCHDVVDIDGALRRGGTVDMRLCTRRFVVAGIN